MKAKYLFTALALPALFAACTNDEFEQIQTPEKIDESVFAGRAVGDLTVFTANEDAETRAGGDVDASGKLKWVITGEDDWLGAAVVDYGKDEAIVGPSTDYDNYVITNLPFVPQASSYPTTAADFKPTTAVVDGAYLFYNRYYGQSTNRRDFRHTIDAITYVDPTDTEYTHLGTADNAGDEENKGQNFFLSPIVDMKVGQDMKATPIMLTSAYNIAQFTFKTDLLPEYYEQEDGFRIHKIELRTMNDNTKFHRTLILDPAKIANLQKEYAETNNLFNTEFKNNGAIITANRSDEEIVTTLKKITEKMQDPGEGQEANIGAYADETSLLTFQVKSNGKDYYSITDKDQEVKLLLILPAGNYSQNETDLPKAIQGKTKGVFKLSVYTSEGVYHSLLVTSEDYPTYTLKRGVKSVFPEQTMIIKHGKTNLETEELKTEFTVNTGEDWRYAIRYINEHALEYNEGNKWHTPFITINAEEVEVDMANKDSRLPNYPVKYSGNAILNLVNVGTYNFDPTKVILDDDYRPTIKIEETTAELNFNMAVKDGIKINETVVGVDGESITAALKLDSKATINIKDGIEVNFETLNSYTALNVADAESAVKAAKVNVSGESIMEGTTVFGAYSQITLTGAASTAGTLDVNSNAVMTAKATYTNSAVATIDSDAKMVLEKGGTNKGTINVKVTGLLDVSKATFTNAAGAALILVAEESGEWDNGDRSIATIKTLVNNGSINIQAGGKEKGTWGGLLEVTSKVTNGAQGNILVNGEFVASKATGVNDGIIQLGKDNYAVIELNGDQFKSQNNGYIEITAPTVYRTFAGYYSKPNQLQDVKGTIVATMNAETLATVWAHHLEYFAKGQETAWQVINKINVEGVLSFSAEQTAMYYKNLVLTNGAEIAAAKANATLTFGKVQVAENAAAAFKSTNAYTLECADIEILKGAKLENGNNVKVYIIPSLTFAEANSATANTKLTINGTLNNYGQLHTTLKEAPTVLKAVVGANGMLNNMGTIGSPAKNPVYYAGTELKLINAINKAYYDFVHTWIIKKSSGSWNWAGSSEVSQSARSWTLFHNYVKALQNYAIWNAESGHPQVAKIGNDYYYITTTGNGSEAAIGSSTNYKSLTVEVQDAVLKIGIKTSDNYIALGTNGAKNYSLIKSAYTTATNVEYQANEHIKKYGHLQDFLFVYVNNGAIKFNNTGAKAYGLIKTNNGTISGEFTEKYDYLLDE